MRKGKRGRKSLLLRNLLPLKESLIQSDDTQKKGGKISKSHQTSEDEGGSGGKSRPKKWELMVKSPSRKKREEEISLD